MWQEHGERYALEMSPERLNRYERAAREAPSGVVPVSQSPELMKEPWYQALAALHYNRMNPSVTHFPYFLASTRGEARPATGLARKALWQAEQARQPGDKQHTT